MCVSCLADVMKSDSSMESKSISLCAFLYLHAGYVDALHMYTAIQPEMCAAHAQESGMFFEAWHHDQSELISTCCWVMQPRAE